MGLDAAFATLPDPGSYTFPDPSIPQGGPVMPVALTSDELDALLDLYEVFAAVDPTGIDTNPVLQATSQFLRETFGTSLERPDERLHDDIAGMLNDFSDDLAGESIGVVDATPAHHRTLYFFLGGCRAYHVAPHVGFDPPVPAVETLAAVFERVREQEYYLKRPGTVLE
jgi:hypothetical protein